MNVDHIGIIVTLIEFIIFISIAFVSQTNINPLSEFTISNNYSMDAYCKQFNIKC